MNSLKLRIFFSRYNYDIVKDAPLEGRYEWIRLKPWRRKKKKKLKIKQMAFILSVFSYSKYSLKAFNFYFYFIIIWFCFCKICTVLSVFLWSGSRRGVCICSLYGSAKELQNPYGKEQNRSIIITNFQFSFWFCFSP